MISKFISTGGIGDSFIAFLKLQEFVNQNPGTWGNVDWLHVESMDFKMQFDSLMCSMVPHSAIAGKQILHRFEHHPDYIKKFLDGQWCERRSVPISFNRKCALHNQEWKVENPFLNIPECKNKTYDIVIQVSAGQKNNKKWFFDPIGLAKILSRNFGYKICLVGNDDRYRKVFLQEEENILNQVCQYQNLSLAIQPIWKTKLFIGLSGLMNYVACATKIPNIHLIEGPDQELDYYHDKWKDLTYGIKNASLAEVMRGINHFKGIGVL